MIEVIQGDCLPVMQGYPDKYFDLVITDPPYGVKRDKGFTSPDRGGAFNRNNKSKKNIASRRTYLEDNWDSDIPSQEVFNEMLRVSKHAIICGGNFFAHCLPRSRHWIFWDKLNTMPSFGDGELIWTNFDNLTSIKKYTLEWNGLIGREDYRWHPTQKPLSLMRYLISKYSEEGHAILDPYAGSGTTLRAAMDLHRDAVGIEISPKYAEIARMRLRQEVLL